MTHICDYMRIEGDKIWKKTLRTMKNMASSRLHLHDSNQLLRCSNVNQLFYRGQLLGSEPEPKAGGYLERN